MELVISDLFICKFEYLQVQIDHFSGMYPPIYGNTWSFYIQIHHHVCKHNFFGPYLLYITRTACIWSPLNKFVATEQQLKNVFQLTFLSAPVITFYLYRLSTIFFCCSTLHHQHWQEVKKESSISFFVALLSSTWSSSFIIAITNWI